MRMQRMLWRVLVLLAVAYGLIGGGWGFAAAYEAIPVQNGGAITGRVTFIGSPPPPKQLKISRDPKVCGTGTRPSEALVVSADGGIKNVVVSIENIPKGKPQAAKKGNPKFVQEGCWFHPHVLLVPAGSTIDLLNHDKVMHNIHTVSKINPVVNKAQPSFRKRLRLKLKKPETIKVRCDMHSWMGGWFIVTAHPYYALTDAHGSFRLTDIPPGTYTLRAWHETLGQQTHEVSIDAHGKTNVVFEFKR